MQNRRGAGLRAESAHLFNSGPARKSHAVRQPAATPWRRACKRGAIVQSAAGEGAHLFNIGPARKSRVVRQPAAAPWRRACREGAMVRRHGPKALTYSPADLHENRGPCNGPKAPLFNSGPARKSRAARRAEASRSGGPQFWQTCVPSAGFAPRTKIAL